MDIITNYTTVLLTLFSIGFSVALLGANAFSCPVKGALFCSVIALSALIHFSSEVSPWYLNELVNLFSIPSEHLIVMFAAAFTGISAMFPLLVRGEASAPIHN